MNHPVLSALAAIHAALDEVAEVDPMFMSVGEKKSALVELARARARLEGLDLSVLAAGRVDVAEDTGARSTATWVADQTRDAPGALRTRARLAEQLTEKWQTTHAALAAGRANPAQPRAIAEALDALPSDLPDGLVGKAEEFLLESAADLGPRELRRLGRGVLQFLAPEVADRVEYAMVQAEEQRADPSTRLWFYRRGDGTTDVHARLPDHAANRLRTFVAAIANPRRAGNGDDFMALPVERRRGVAFQSLLETVLEADLPRHGQTATSVVVTTTLETLVSGLGTATTSTGDLLTAGQARRLACQAGILPAVLDSKGAVLDLGRSARFFRGYLRKAIDLRDKECTVRGCHIPAAYCHAHHFRKPWARGGRTSLADGKLLCPFHHGRAHDDNWETHHHPDGSTTFTRRPLAPGPSG